MPNYEAYIELGGVLDLPRAQDVTHLAVRIANNVPHFDPDN